MSVASPPMGGMFQFAPYPVRKFTVDEYHQMIQMGLLTEDDPVELLEGWIVPKMPQNPSHDGTIDITREVVESRLPSGWRFRIQSAITLSDSEPEPDLVAVEGPASRFMDHHPGPSEIGMVIEVANSSLDRDRNDKGRLFARAGISIYWIINLIDLQVEVYTDPTGPDASPRYRQRQDYDRNAAVPVIIAGQQAGQVAVRELLP